MTSSVVGLRRSSKALPKAKVAPRKGHVYCLVVCCLSGPLQLTESQGKCYIWEVCSANRWGALKTAIPTASIGQQNRPVFLMTLYNQHFNGWTNWAMKFCLMCHIHLTSHQPTTTCSSISTTFCRENSSINSRRQKMLSKFSSDPEARILYYRNKTYFSLAKMCWL